MDWASRFLKENVYTDITKVFYHKGLRLVFTKEVWEQMPMYKSTWKFDYINGIVING